MLKKLFGADKSPSKEENSWVKDPKAPEPDFVRDFNPEQHPLVEKYYTDLHGYAKNWSKASSKNFWDTIDL